MSSTYAPLPFSYLAAGSQAPKTGFLKDEGLYESRKDMAQPIAALRHDQPRRAADWSIDNMLRGGPGGDVTPAERRRPTTHDPDDAQSTPSAFGNLRLPRQDVSLYQSQVDGPAASRPVIRSEHFITLNSCLKKCACHGV